MKEAKQVLVVRKDLQMRKGKIAAQCAHASTGVLLSRMLKNKDGFRMPCDAGSAMHAWLHTGHAKICVYVESEEELLEIEARAHKSKVMTYLVTDAGRTEFHGVPTRTVLAVGPAFNEKIDRITGHLKLL